MRSVNPLLLPLECYLRELDVCTYLAYSFSEALSIAPDSRDWSLDEPEYKARLAYRQAKTTNTKVRRQNKSTFGSF